MGGKDVVYKIGAPACSGALSGLCRGLSSTPVPSEDQRLGDGSSLPDPSQAHRFPDEISFHEAEEDCRRPGNRPGGHRRR